MVFRNITKDKKSTFSLLCDLIIIIVSIFSVIFLLSSYQKYMINSVLEKDNWDTKISNIKYKELEKIKEDNNIEEISKTYHIGKTNIPSKRYKYNIFGPICLW